MKKDETEEKANREMQYFFHNIRVLRKQHQLSKTKMAKILGISVSTLNKLENGEMPPRLNMSVFYRIHRHFGITPSEILSAPQKES